MAVAKKNKTAGAAFAAVVAVSICCGIFSCASIPLLVPNPPLPENKEIPRETTRPAPAVTEPVRPASEQVVARETPRAEPVVGQSEAAARTNGGKEVDFAFALLDTNTPGISQSPDGAASPAETDKTRKEGSIPFPRRTIRVAILRNVSQQALYSMDTMDIRAASLSKSPWFRGRIVVSRRGPGTASLTAGSGPAREVSLPCTLCARSELNLVGVDGENYRGSVIITGARTLTIVNYLDVEEYLRGVLPLEMGDGGEGSAEALKAQAVTARTYAYKRMSGRQAEDFDLVGTVSDQVYRGADAETVAADRAVAATRDLVLVWRGSLADVYYHSTCGGATADIAEAWGRSACPYLTSVIDAKPDGSAWCSWSPRFTWETRWNAESISKIVRATAKKTIPEGTFSGRLEDISVYARFECGRIKTCALKGSGESVVCGGDKIRFVLRPKSATGDILKSANFTVITNGPDEFVVKGSGFGHGVGLCQTGALGRSKAGQTFTQVLSAYFPGTDISRLAAAGTNEEEPW